jgi:hypothetical protein
MTCVTSITRSARGHFFYGDIANDGVLLFTTRKYELAKPKARDRGERYELTLKYFDYWFRTASEFWHGAVYYAGRAWHLRKHAAKERNEIERCELSQHDFADHGRVRLTLFKSKPCITGRGTFRSSAAFTGESTAISRSCVRCLAVRIVALLGVYCAKVCVGSSCPWFLAPRAVDDNSKRQ